MNPRDKNGRQIERGDILKVFHFTGARNKRHYMYKQALGIKTLGSGTEYMMFSHLGMDDQYYVEPCNGQCLTDYEIVQSIDAKFDERPRATIPPARCPVCDGAKVIYDCEKGCDECRRPCYECQPALPPADRQPAEKTEASQS